MAALGLLASGVYLTSIGRFWTLGWVQVATAFWVVNTALAAAVMRPALDRVTEAAAGAGGATIGADLDALRNSAPWSWSVDVMAANDAAMLYLMTLRPGLAGSVAVVVLANLGVAGGRYLFGRLAPGSPRPARRPGPDGQPPDPERTGGSCRSTPRSTASVGSSPPFPTK